jgi:hypothetical protein
MSSAAPAPSTRTAGTKCAFWYRLTVPPGQTAELRLRLRPAQSERVGSREAGSAAGAPAALGAGFDQVMATRRAEADEFYAELTPAGASADEATVLRQACAGLLWGKQLYYVDFLSGIFDKLLVNFTWWVNRLDARDKNVFEGGFLGLDNIGPIDRSHLPTGYTLEQSDATAVTSQRFAWKAKHRSKVP